MLENAAAGVQYPENDLEHHHLDEVTKRRNRYLEISRDSIEGKKNGRQHGKNVAKAVSQKVQYF